MEKTHVQPHGAETQGQDQNSAELSPLCEASHSGRELPADDASGIGGRGGSEPLHAGGLALEGDTASGPAGSSAECAGARAADLSAPEWNDARVERLQYLWQLGWSAALIAKDLGHLTRNAVLGKIHRLGISERPNGFKQHPNCHRRRNPLTPYEKAQRQKRRITIRQARAPQVIPVIKLVQPESKRLTLFDLTPTSCRWMHGEPSESNFCGQEVVEGHSWCAYHVRLVYTKPPNVSDRDRAARSFRAKKLLLERQRHNGVSRHFLEEGA